ncbi:hypothetical protein MRX96_013588 [Rhipicephalus microplus]
MKSARVRKSFLPPTAKATNQKGSQHEQGDVRKRNQQAHCQEQTEECEDPQQVVHHAFAHRTRHAEPPEPFSLGNLVAGTNRRVCVPPLGDGVPAHHVT